MLMNMIETLQNCFSYSWREVDNVDWMWFPLWVTFLQPAVTVL